MITLCATCWRDPTLDHARHEGIEKHVVAGRIAAPPDIAPARLLEMIDRAIAKQGSMHPIFTQRQGKLRVKRSTGAGLIC